MSAQSTALSVLFLVLHAACQPENSHVTVGATGELSLLDEDALDLTAYTAMRDDDLPTAQAVFSEMLLRDSEDAFAAQWLGHVAVRRSNLLLAEQAFAHAVASVGGRMSVEDDNEAFALQAKQAQLELSLRRVRERRRARTSGSTGLSVMEIPRVHWKDLSHERFETEFAEARKPVIIEGLGTLNHPGTPLWSLEHLRSICGHLVAPIKRFKSRSTAWGGLESVEGSPITFGAYLDALGTSGYDGSAMSSGGVLFDWSLRNEGGCRELLAGLQVPSYFSGSILSGYGPSLFVQPNGTRCGLHVDRGSTHFWQYVWSGAKRWRIFDVEDWPHLFAAGPGGAWERAFFRDARCTGIFGAESMEAAGCDDAYGGAALDAFDDALLERAAGDMQLRVMEATLRAGDLLFVPADSPHQVINVGGHEEPTMAVSMNYVDRTNANVSFRASLESAEVHPRFRSRLRKKGTVIPGSQARWYESFRMPVRRDEDHRGVKAAIANAAAGPRPSEAFLEPWPVFEQMPWNRHDR